MTKLTASNGWERLPCGCDLELQHGIPVRVSCPGGIPDPGGTDLSAEVAALTGLHITLEEWLPGESAGEVEAKTRVNGEQFSEVLNRLALSAAAVFFDRYHKSVTGDDVDWDTQEYANDFTRALEYCGLDWDDVNKDTCRAAYLNTMHAETRRLATDTEPPRIAPESG